jgi:hypothetical protein
VKVSPDTEAVTDALRTLADRISGDATTAAEPLSESDRLAQAEADAIYVGINAVTVDEIRRMRFGLGPLPDRANLLACCICSSADIAYHNHDDKPFCDPCADAGPPRMIRMHEGEQHRTIGPEWREIFPGLQAKVGNVQYLMTEHGNTPDVTVLYRITPKD